MTLELPIHIKSWDNLYVEQLKDLPAEAFNDAIQLVFPTIKVEVVNQVMVSTFANKSYQISIKEENPLLVRSKLCNILEAVYPGKKINEIDLQLLDIYATA